MAKRNPPFNKLVNQLVKKQGYTIREARMELQLRLDKIFDNLNQLKERVDKELNTTSRLLVGQLITLATLLLTVTGLFISQTAILKSFHWLQKLLVVITFVSLLVSVGLGIWNYILASKYYKDWQQKLNDTTKTIDKGIASGKFQLIGDVIKKQDAILGGMPINSGDRIEKAQLWAVLIGGASFTLLLVITLFTKLGN